jgi:peptidyl-prolyl cis-trans isomerase C
MMNIRTCISPAHRLAALTGLVLAAALWIALPEASAQSTTGEAGEDPVVARVNGKEIRRSEVIASAASLPPQYQAQIDTIFPALVERLVDLEVVTQAAKEAGLEEEPAYQERFEEAKTNIVRELFVQGYIDEALTEEALQQRYQDFLAENPPTEEIKARHILVENEEDAKAVIEELAGGADFATVASEKSIGPSASQGGDLGFFGKGSMVPEFEEAAFALEPGQVSETPVQTQFGWHVIKVEERREQAPPSFEEVEAQLSQEIQREAVQEMVQGLRDEAEVEILVATEPPAETPDEGASESEEETPEQSQ